jgi:hypothetical protein
MGINLSFVDFFDVCYQQGIIRSPMTALGSLEIHDPPEEIRKFALQNSYQNLAEDKSVRSLFQDRYQVTDYSDLDLNDEADIKFDLTKPLPPELVNSCMTTINGGTLEHIFDIAQALRNIHDLTMSGGAIIHIVPISWYEHGYYNFNPLLFRALARTNQYRLAVESFHFDPTISNHKDSETKVHITYDGKEYTPSSASLFDDFFNNPIPVHVLYMAAYIKQGSSAFKFPYDVQEHEVSKDTCGIDLTHAVNIPGPFLKSDGYAWQYMLIEYEDDADCLADPRRSSLVLLEDGSPLRKWHALHDDIRQIGSGRYSHWQNYLLFSTSDNSDPNTNGRTYRIVMAKIDR